VVKILAHERFRLRRYLALEVTSASRSLIETLAGPFPKAMCFHLGGQLLTAKAVQR
jgi:hypothetical protein